MRVLIAAVGFALVVAAPASGRGPTVPRLALWMEVSANLPALSTREGVAAVLDRAKAAGVTVVIPEVKNAWGAVTYASEFAPHIRASPVPRLFPPTYPPPATWYPPDYDQLAVVVEEAHRRGIQVHAVVNVFGEGNNLAQVGMVFERPHWQAQHLAPFGGIVPASQVGEIAFANPALPEVQLYELAIIAEILQRYDVDGIVLDRTRYPEMAADLSEDSRLRFERWLGRPVSRWPDEVVQAGQSGIVPGPLFRPWVAWRAGIIRQFVAAASRVARGLRPDVAFAAYVGAWYPVYYAEGVNWAAPSAALPYWWVTEPWREAAIGQYFDYLMVGLYYQDISAVDARRARVPAWMSVEGGALLARNLTAGATTPVASLLLPLYEGQPERFRAALHSAQALTGGVMLFDLVYLDRYEWWDLLSP